MKLTDCFDTNSRTPLKTGACIALLAVICAGSAFAQLDYTDANGPRTFAPITPPPAQIVDLSTQYLSPLISPTGFSFNFAGATHTDFVIARGGFISLGFIGASSNPTFFETALRHPLVSPYGVADLSYGPSSEIGWEFQGGVLTVQWLNMEDLEQVAGSGNPPVVSFQAILDTATGAIEFSYSAISGGPYAPRTYGDMVALLADDSVNGRVSRAASIAGFVDIEGTVTAWPDQTYIRFDPTGTTRNAPTVQVSVKGSQIFHQNAAVLSPGELISDVSLLISLNDADGDMVFVNATIGGTPGTGVVASEFSCGPTAVPFSLQPTSGSLPDFTFFSVILRVHDGQDGIRTLIFYVRAQNSAPPTPPPGQFVLNPVAELILTLVFAGLKGGCVAQEGDCWLALSALMALAVMAALRRRRLSS